MDRDSHFPLSYDKNSRKKRDYTVRSRLVCWSDLRKYRDLADGALGAALSAGARGGAAAVLGRALRGGFLLGGLFFVRLLLLVFLLLAFGRLVLEVLRIYKKHMLF